MQQHQRKASELELDEISKLIEEGRSKVDAIRIVYEKKTKEGVSSDNRTKETLRPKVSRSSSIVVKASVEEIESKKLKRNSKHKSKNGNLELPSTVFDSDASHHSERDEYFVLSTAVSTRNEYHQETVDSCPRLLNFASNKGLAISVVPDSNSVGSDIGFSLTPSPRRSLSNCLNSRASARVNYSQYDQEEDDDELIFSDNLLAQHNKNSVRMLGKDSVRASQRVDYSGYEDDDEDNIVYEDNVIPHKELPPLQHNVLKVGDTPAADTVPKSSSSDKKSIRMLGKDSVRASQRVDYSDYVNEDDNEDDIVYEDNVIPHKKPQLRKHHVLTLDDNPVADAVPKASQKSVRMLGKDSIRASLRVDYSGYVDDDEDDIVYEDNVISNKKPQLRKHHVPTLDANQATNASSTTTPFTKFARMLGKGGIRASQRVDYSDYVDENQDADKITYEENSLPHTKPQSRKSIRFLGMNDPHVDEGDDNVTYEDNMILHEKPQTKKPFQMLSKPSVRASMRVDYSDYMDEDEDNITYEDNLIPHEKYQHRTQKPSQVNAPTRNFSSFGEEDEDNITYEDKLIPNKSGGRKLEKRSVVRIDPSSIQLSDDETEELAANGRIHNLHGSTDLRATKREGYSENDKQQLQFQEMYVPQILSQDSHSKGSEVQISEASAQDKYGPKMNSAEFSTGTGATHKTSSSGQKKPENSSTNGNTPSLKEIMDFKPEVTAEDYLEIQYLMSLGLLKLPAIEAYLEKLRSNGSILRGDRPGSLIVTALVNQGLKPENGVDYFLNKFSEVLKSVIPESIDIHLTEPRGAQQPNDNPSSANPAKNPLSREDEEIISMLMEQRKIDKKTATELYLSILLSEDETGQGLKARSSVGDTGGGLDGDVKHVKVVESAFFSGTSLDISEIKKTEKHSRSSAPAATKDQSNNADDEEVKTLNRILADQDSKFGINMLGLDLNEDEEDEVAHLKSMGFTAIESLTAVFERRMVIKPISQRKSAKNGKISGANNAKGVTISLSRQNSYFDASKISSILGSVDADESDFFHSKIENSKLRRGLEGYAVSPEYGNTPFHSKSSRSQAEVQDFSGGFQSYANSRSARSKSAEAAAQRLQQPPNHNSDTWGLKQPLRIPRNAHVSAENTKKEETHRHALLPPPQPPLPKHLPSMQNLILPDDYYHNNVVRTEPTLSTVRSMTHMPTQQQNVFRTESFGGYMYHPKPTLSRNPSMYESATQLTDYEFRFGRILPHYAEIDNSVSSGLVKSRVMDINKRLQNASPHSFNRRTTSSSSASLHSYVPRMNHSSQRSDSSTRSTRSYNRRGGEAKSKLSADEEALEIGKLLSFQQIHFGTNMYDSLVQEDKPYIDHLVRIGHTQIDAILIVFQEKCAREYIVRTSVHHKKRDRSTIGGGVDYYRRIRGARKNVSADDEALEIGKLLSYQQILYGTNMYDSLLPEDNPYIEQLVLLGHSEGEAILLTFQDKCDRRLVSRDIFRTRQSYPLQEERLQPQPVQALPVESVVSSAGDDQLATAIRLSQLGDHSLPGVIRISGTGNSRSEPNAARTNQNGSSGSGVRSDPTSHQRRGFFDRIFNRSSTDGPIAQLVDLGFTRDQASRALRDANNNVDQAAAILLGNG